MPPASRLFLVLGMVSLAQPALALRCQSRIISEGDPQAKVLRFCGEPTAVQQRVIYRAGIPGGWVNRGVVVRSGQSEIRVASEELLIHQRSVVEVLVEEWTYNLGPRKLMRVVQFENGVVKDVRRLGYGYVE